MTTTGEMQKGGEKHQYGDKMTEDVTWKAVTAGMWRALPFAAASFGGVYWAAANVPWFAKSFGPSGRIALAMSPPMFAWSYFSEVGIGKALDKNLEVQSGVSAEVSERLPFKLRAANYLFENTLFAYLCLVTPAYGLILGNELAKPRPPHWKFSHAVIHTRVIGQAIAIGTLVVVFGGREALKRNGAPFKLPDADNESIYPSTR